MQRAHAQLAVTQAAFDRVVGYLAAALAEAGLDQDTIATAGPAVPGPAVPGPAVPGPAAAG